MSPRRAGDEQEARALMTVSPPQKDWKSRNLVAFWIFGVCNNFAYIVMLCAAQDILNKHEVLDPAKETAVEKCIPDTGTRHCTARSAGVVLLCNIFPALVIKAIYPFVARRFPYSVRHAIVCFTSALSLIITSTAESVPVALVGVMLASLSSGMGETTYLGLASHFTKHTISTWSSGTGMAGIAGAFSYAGLTDTHMIGLTPSQAMLVMLVVPVIFMATYHCLLQQPEDLVTATINPLTWIIFEPSTSDTSKKSKKIDSCSNTMDEIQGKEVTRKEKWLIAKSLFKYMIPLFFVYFAEYLINQGLVELIVFDCSHGFGTSPTAQYRWYQVLYQVGVFISRSSINLAQMNMTGIALMPVLQLLNLVFFIFNAIYQFVPHFGMVAGLVFYEGLIGGASYVNSFNHIHKKIDPSIREFALSTVTLADTMGILVAALTAIPVHNAICNIPLGA